MAPEEITLEFDQKTIAARRWGRGGVPVLALHGWLDNCASFDRLAPLLPGLDLVAVDMAGHGRSYHRSHDASYNLHEEVVDVMGMAHALGWRKFSILAHSRGAIVGVLAAGAFPDRIEKLALIDGLVPPRVEAETAPEVLAHAVAQRARYHGRKPRHFASLEEAVEARKRGMFKLSVEAARALTERGTRDSGDGLTWSSDPRLMEASSAKFSPEQVWAFLDRAKMPMRLALASEGIEGMADRLKPVLAGRDNITACQFAGGHHLHMDAAADELAQWFAGFLAEPAESTGAESG